MELLSLITTIAVISITRGSIGDVAKLNTSHEIHNPFLIHFVSTVVSSPLDYPHLIPNEDFLKPK